MVYSPQSKTFDAEVTSGHAHKESRGRWNPGSGGLANGPQRARGKRVRPRVSETQSQRYGLEACWRFCIEMRRAVFSALRPKVVPQSFYSALCIAQGAEFFSAHFRPTAGRRRQSQRFAAPPFDPFRKEIPHGKTLCRPRIRPPHRPRRQGAHGPCLRSQPDPPGRAAGRRRRAQALPLLLLHGHEAEFRHRHVLPGDPPDPAQAPRRRDHRRAGCPCAPGASTCAPSSARRCRPWSPALPTWA